MRAWTLFVGLVLLGAWFSLAGGAPVINEVGWGGRPDDPTGEWIELYNPDEQPIDLDGWRLYSSDGAPDISLHGTIAGNGYFLLERGSDAAVPGVKADQIYSGALRDSGEALYLVDPVGNIVDTANRERTGWPAGTNQLGSPPCATMERIDPNVPEDWATSQAPGGTPRARNSASNLPPQGEFTFSPSPAHPDEPVLFDATNAYDPNGTIISFAWDFGDGDTGAGQTASHTYREVGVYTVSLTMKDNAGAVTQVERTVPVVKPRKVLVDFSVLPPDGKRIMQSGDPITFSDESLVVEGSLLDWTWAFGDGATGRGQTASHTYSSGGVYVVTHTVIDDQGERAVQTRPIVIHGRYPSAAFKFTPSIPDAGAVVTFDATASFDPDGTDLNYEWDFTSDGMIDLVTSQPLTTHTYPEAGDYTVTLVVADSDPDGTKRSLPTTLPLHVNAPPVASFKVSNFSPLETDSVAFSDCSTDPDGKITAWEWDFGDGSSSTEQNPSHSYQEAGSYAVSLTVTDDNGARAQTAAKIVIKNHPPVAAIEVKGKDRVMTGEPIEFTAAGSHDVPETHKLSCYEWDFDGDGSYDTRTDSPTATHSYPDDGSYPVTVRVTDAAGASAVSSPVTITVLNRAPTAGFTWSPPSPTDAEVVQFSDSSTDPDGKVTGWRWDFGDGTSSTEQNPAHSYPDDGTYRVTLIVTDDDGTASAPITREITVVNAAPSARFDAPDAVAVGEPVQFTNASHDPSPNGKIVHVAWDFGDGTTCPGAPGGCGEGDPSAPVHVYTASGTYTVELVVIDDDGAIGAYRREISVTGGD